VDGEDLVTVYPASSVHMERSALEAKNVTGSLLTPGAEWLETLTVVMPPLEDEDHWKELTLVLGHRRFGGAAGGSNAALCHYQRPELDEVQNALGASLAATVESDLVLVGDNFGSVGTVYFNKQAVDEGRVTSWTDTEIKLTVVAVTGNVTVGVGDYRSKTLSFDDFSPILFTTLPQFAPDPSGYRTDGKEVGCNASSAPLQGLLSISFLKV
jgi:hypothetical protein